MPLLPSYPTGSASHFSFLSVDKTQNPRSIFNNDNNNKLLRTACYKQTLKSVEFSAARYKRPLLPPKPAQGMYSLLPCCCNKIPDKQLKEKRGLFQFKVCEYGVHHRVGRQLAILKQQSGSREINPGAQLTSLTPTPNSFFPV